MCKYINTSSCIHARYGKSRKYCRHHSKCVKLFIFSSRKYPQKKNVINDRYEQNEEGTVSASRACEHESKKEAKSKSQEIVWLSKRIQAFTKRWQLWGNIANQKWWWRWEREWIQIDDDDDDVEEEEKNSILYAVWFYMLCGLKLWKYSRVTYHRSMYMAHSWCWMKQEY